MTLAEKQAAAAIGQSRLMEIYRGVFEPAGIEVAQVLLSRGELESPRRVGHLRRALSALTHHGVLPIVNENDTIAVEELKIGDNDTLAALLAVVAGADLLVLLTDIDGFYEQDPRRHAGARRIAVIEEWLPSLSAAAGRAGSGVGTGGMQTKLGAARIAAAAGIDTVVARTRPGVLKAVLRGDDVGTLFRGHPQPGPRRAVWLRYGARPRGRLILDDGAAQAVERQAASLLLPGITECRGAFQAGDVVELATTAERVIARGTALVGAQELVRWLAMQEREAPRAVRVVQHRTMVMAGEGLDGGLEQG
jgi:glutamate 5-kinase